MTPFRFEHDFRNASPGDVLALYFDQGHSDAQDAIAEIDHREVLALDETADQLVRVMKVYPKRQLPAVASSFVNGKIHYTERLIWKKKEDRIDLEVRPSVMTEKTFIGITYRVVQKAPGVVLRTYEGKVTCDVRLIGGRVEKFIVDDLGRSLSATHRCTQDWLDRRAAAR